MRQITTPVIKRIKSFRHAFNGFFVLIKEEPNARIHLLAAVIAILLGLFLGISRTEWLIVGILISFVFAMELLNSAIENLSDFVSPEKNDFIKKAKDQGAAAVLVAAIISLIIGLCIFTPRVLEWIEDF